MYVIVVQDTHGKILHVVECSSFKDMQTRLAVLIDPCVFGNDDYRVTARPISMA